MQQHSLTICDKKMFLIELFFIEKKQRVLWKLISRLSKIQIVKKKTKNTNGPIVVQMSKSICNLLESFN
jgi:hypothetical protein